MKQNLKPKADGAGSKGRGGGRGGGGRADGKGFPPMQNRAGKPRPMDTSKEEYVVAPIPDWVVPDPLSHIPGIDDGPEDSIWTDVGVDPHDESKYTLGVDMLKPRIWTDLDFEMEGDMAADVIEYNKQRWIPDPRNPNFGRPKAKQPQKKGNLEPKTEEDKVLLEFVDQMEDDPEIETGTPQTPEPELTR